MEETEIIHGLRSGDRAARSAFVRTYSDALLRFICGRLLISAVHLPSQASRHFISTAADDILSETFLAAFLNIGSYRETSRLKTWLYAIAKNKVIDFLREQSRQKFVPGKPATEGARTVDEDRKQQYDPSDLIKVEMLEAAEAVASEPPAKVISDRSRRFAVQRAAAWQVRVASPEALYEANELRDALGQLEEIQRQALCLRFLDGFSIEESAEILETTEGAVKMACDRGKKRLREILSRVPPQKLGKQ